MPKFQTCLVAAIMFTAVPAAAQPIVVEAAVPSVSVSYADLDLSSASGRQTLEGRVARAASSLCTESGRKSLDTAMWEHRCLSSALSKARTDIGRASADSSARVASKATILVAAR